MWRSDSATAITWWNLRTSEADFIGGSASTGSATCCSGAGCQPRQPVQPRAMMLAHSLRRVAGLPAGAVFGPVAQARHHNVACPRGYSPSRLRPGTLQLATDWTPCADGLSAEWAPEFRNLSPDNGWVPRDVARNPTRYERRGERSVMRA
jgi:hypothetical protein